MIYSKLYWRIGFQSRLYDLLAPEAYFESMRQLINAVPIGPNSIIIDAGYGSGLILKYLKLKYWEGSYFGIDLLLEGLLSARIKAKQEGLSNKTYFIQSDLTQSIPMVSNSVDIILAHFSLYTMNSGEVFF